MLSLRREVPCHRPAHRLSTLAVAITALMFAASVVADRIDRPHHEMSKEKMTLIKASKYAYEAFPSWSAAHPDQRCPARLADLDEYMYSDDERDAWDQPLVMMCGTDLPPGVKGIAVLSAGADGKYGTCDDLESWAPRHGCD